MVNGEEESSWERLDVVGVVRPGVIGGIIAGAVFAVAEVIVAALMATRLRSRCKWWGPSS